MADLLSSEAVEQFRGAMRNVTDTFHRYPVVLGRAVGGTVDLLAGMKAITDEYRPREGGNEIDEAFRLTFNRDYLAEKGLVDAGGNLLVTYDDTVTMGGKKFFIATILEPVAFRDKPIMVKLEVAR